MYKDFSSEVQMFFVRKIKAFPYWEGCLIINIIIFITIDFQLVYQDNLMQTLHQLL